MEFTEEDIYDTDKAYHIALETLSRFKLRMDEEDEECVDFRFTSPKVVSTWFEGF